LADLQCTGKAGIWDLIRGYNRTVAMNARKKSLQAPLDKVSENAPLDRIAELERQVAELRRAVALLKQLAGWPVFSDGSEELERKKKPGPKERISDEVLFDYRDALILWLERFWSWLEDRLSAASTIEQVRAIFEAVAEQPQLRPEWQKRLLENIAALHEFLGTERFGKTLPEATATDALNLPLHNEKRHRAANQFPSRQIANAMAGVPDLSWRRSLDRCTAHPSGAYVPVSMDMYYRDKYNIPTSEDLDLTGASCPVPKPLPTVLAHSSDDSNSRVQPK
jgi:hypothetical protein